MSGPGVSQIPGSASNLLQEPWTLANKITLARIVLVPIFAATYLSFHDEGYPKLLIPLFIFLVATASDGLDGYIARTRNQRSELGSILDPVADKLLVVTSLLLLCFLGPQGAIPFWLVSAVVSRDLLLMSGGLLAGAMKGRLVVRPSRTGKLATCFMMTCVVWGMTQLNRHVPEWMNATLWWSTTLLVLISGLGYGIQGCRQAADPTSRE